MQIYLEFALLAVTSLFSNRHEGMSVYYFPTGNRETVSGSCGLRANIYSAIFIICRLYAESCEIQ